MKNTQPKIKQFKHQRGIKYKFLDYRLQFIRAYHSNKVNEE